METETAPFPKTKWPLEKDIESFYGKIKLGSDGRPTASWEATNLTTASVPFHLKLSWDESVTIRKFTCHRVVRPVLETIFEEIWNLYGKDPKAISESRMDRFGGCYNFRRMRGGSRLSTHAWGIAVDLDPEKNPLGKPYNKDHGMIPMEVVEIFTKYGAEWGGKWSRADAQHFQFARTK
jgi:hypothetical protein